MSFNSDNELYHHIVNTRTINPDWVAREWMPKLKQSKHGKLRLKDYRVFVMLKDQLDQEEVKYLTSSGGGTDSAAKWWQIDLV